MTRAHRATVLALAPRFLRKVFTFTGAQVLMSQFDPQDLEDLVAPGARSHVAAHELRDILNPIGQEAEVFAMGAANRQHPSADT